MAETFKWALTFWAAGAVVWVACVVAATLVVAVAKTAIEKREARRQKGLSKELWEKVSKVIEGRER